MCDSALGDPGPLCSHVKFALHRTTKIYSKVFSKVVGRVTKINMVFSMTLQKTVHIEQFMNGIVSKSFLCLQSVDGVTTLSNRCVSVMAVMVL